MTRQLKSVKSNPLASRIKKVMQADEDVGKIAQGAPVLVSRAVELFLAHLCEGTADFVSRTTSRTATPSHLKAFVVSAKKLDFLTEKFAAVPDLVDSEVKEAPAKRQRGGGNQADNSDRSLSSPPSSSGRSGRGRGRSRGRGSVRITAQDSRDGHIKTEHGSAELDTAMPDAYAQQVKQESSMVQLEPALPVKAEQGSAAEVSAPGPQPQLKAEHTLTSKATAATPALSSPVHSPTHMAQQPPAASQLAAQPEGSHKAHESNVTLSAHMPVMQSHSTLPVGLHPLQGSLEVLPEEDDYDADE